MLRTSVIAVAIALLCAAAPSADAGEREEGHRKSRARVETGRSHHVSPGVRHHGYRRHLRWEPGHYVVRTERIWVPGYYRYEEIPAVYHEVFVRVGKVKLVLARPACTRKVWVPGYEKDKKVKVWVPGRYVRVAHPRPAVRYVRHTR